MTTPVSAYGARLRRAREHAGLTIWQASRVFAKRAGLAAVGAGLIAAKLDAMENGIQGSYLVPSDEQLAEIAEVYAASPVWLESGAEPEIADVSGSTDA